MQKTTRQGGEVGLREPHEYRRHESPQTSTQDSVPGENVPGIHGTEPAKDEAPDERSAKAAAAAGPFDRKLTTTEE